MNESSYTPTSPLLLPIAQELILIDRNSELIVEEIPAWLAESLGKTRESIIGGKAAAILEPLLPGVAELARSVNLYKKPVSEYQTMFIDPNGNSHNLQLSAIPIELPDGRSGAKVFITQQDVEAESTQHARLNDRPAIPSFHGIVGASEAIKRVFNKIRMYGVITAPVLITGETGAGKEGVARALHYVSRRASGPFEAVNCSAITEALFESEFFGHEKGSFTGALRMHKGRFERAHSGTLFLDEIGDLPASFQTKLLRVIETEMIDRVGAEQSVKIDVRLVAATNRNLEYEVAQRSFRADLFYRIGALHISIPPLRERVEDLSLLVNHFIGVLNRKYDRSVICLTPEALHLLRQYQWPGNVRELRNLMERLFAENSTDVIGLRSLREWYEERVSVGTSRAYNPNVTVLPYRPAIPLGMGGHTDEEGIRTSSVGGSYSPVQADSRASFAAALPPPLKPVVDKPILDVATIRRAFCEAGGNMTRTAMLLGIHKATLYRLLKSLDLDRAALEKHLQG
ncbi:MAG: sigma-54-dependent Fis family transcriptional regulator [Candidatus Riflebacteria bacterium]|nr:sigma-54-dependent Fis family transcriptional regulator [Candidatus Riflebacteria bacterium]